MSEEDDNVVRLPTRPANTDAPLRLVSPFGQACEHRRAIVDPDLAELECADCHAKINPIRFLEKMARQLTTWQLQAKQALEAARELDKRRRVRCTHCGQWTQIRRVSEREVARIREAAAEKPYVTPTNPDDPQADSR